MDNLIKILYGKVANQFPRKRISGVCCEACSKIIESPAPGGIYIGKRAKYLLPHSFLIFSYDPCQKEMIYETKSGFAVCYCSEHCARKHNHRFN